MIFIPFNTPSSKNSRRNYGKFSLPSINVEKYIKATESYYKDNKDNFLKELEGKTKPYFIGLHFVRLTRRQFDFNNANAIVTDLLKKYGWIEDDNMNEIVAVPMEIDGKLYTYDKNNPGVYIKVFDKLILE